MNKRKFIRNVMHEFNKKYKYNRLTSLVLIYLSPLVELYDSDPEIVTHNSFESLADQLYTWGIHEGLI